jgi:FtsZ-binding cell division protein ZapB
LTKVAEKIITERGGESLQKHVAELEEENSRLKATATELQKSVDSSAETITVLQHSVDDGVEDYNLLMAGNESMLAEHNELRYRSEDLESELSKVHASTTEDIAALEAKIRSAEAHATNVAVTGEKCLYYFETELLKDLAELHVLYECNVQNIEGLCSAMPTREPSVANYIHWLSAEVTSLPEVFAGVNENFVSITVEGTLVMARGSVDLAALQASTADSRVDILPVEQDVQKMTRVVSKKW